MDRAPIDFGTIKLANEVRALALAKALRNMRRFGNGISDTHLQALADLQQGLSSQTFLKRERVAYGLPCGAGKTLSVIAFIAANIERGLGSSFAVSASHIEALIALRRALIAEGVAPELIGLRHSFGPKASEPDTGDSDRQIMLLSHSRIRGGRDSNLCLQHNGRPRDLLIWDETLIAAETDVLALNEALFDSKKVLDSLASVTPLADALRIAVATIEAEIAGQRAGAPPRDLHLFDGTDLEALRAEVKRLGAFGSDSRRSGFQTVGKLLRLVERPTSIALTGNGETGNGIIRYRVSIDAGLTNVAVLDASHPVRILAKNGDVRDGTTEAMKACKSYSRVNVREVPVATGRSTLSARKRAKEMAAKIAELVGDIPPDERILIFTFKGDEKRTMLANLQADLRNAGVDIDRMVDGGPRYSFLTWGNECSLNEYAQCRHVILGGVLRRSALDLAAAIAALHEDIRYRMTSEELREVQTSEIAHCVLQAMNRGSCRTVDNDGRASEMNLTILANVMGLRELLAPALPNVKWKVDAKFRASPTETAHVSSSILRQLAGLPDERGSVSCQKLKELVSADLGRSVSRDIWRVGLEQSLLATIALPGSRWERLKWAGSVTRHQH